SFIWDARTQLGPQAITAVAVRVTPSNVAGPGVASTSGVFPIGNDLPVLSAVTVTGTALQPIIKFSLADSSGDVCSIAPAFRVGTSGAFTSLGSFVAAGATVGLVTTASATTTYSFAWDAAGQLGSGLKTVQIQLMPNDAFADGGAVISATFTAGIAPAVGQLLAAVATPVRDAASVA